MLPIGPSGTSWECHIPRIGLEKPVTLHSPRPPSHDPVATVTPWLVTRARDESAALVEALVRAGLKASALPCIERRPIEWAPDLAAWAGRKTLFMVTSPFGARRLIDCWPTLEGHGIVAALAPTTVRVLEAAHIPVAISAPGGAAGLARAAASPSRSRPPSDCVPSANCIASSPMRRAVRMICRRGSTSGRANARRPCSSVRPPAGIFSPRAARLPADPCSSGSRASGNRRSGRGRKRGRADFRPRCIRRAKRHSSTGPGPCASANCAARING